MHHPNRDKDLLPSNLGEYRDWNLLKAIEIDPQKAYQNLFHSVSTPAPMYISNILVTEIDLRYTWISRFLQRKLVHISRGLL